MCDRGGQVKTMSVVLGGRADAYTAHRETVSVEDECLGTLSLQVRKVKVGQKTDGQSGFGREVGLREPLGTPDMKGKQEIRPAEQRTKCSGWENWKSGFEFQEEMTNTVKTRRVEDSNNAKCPMDPVLRKRKCALCLSSLGRVKLTDNHWLESE